MLLMLLLVNGETYFSNEVQQQTRLFPIQALPHPLRVYLARAH